MVWQLQVWFKREKVLREVQQTCPLLLGVPSSQTKQGGPSREAHEANKPNRPRERERERERERSAGGGGGVISDLWEESVPRDQSVPSGFLPILLQEKQ